MSAAAFFEIDIQSDNCIFLTEISEFFFSLLFFLFFPEKQKIEFV
jgi:hypothetical protein